MHPVAFRDPFERTSQSLHTVVIIPARYHSTRCPAKILADIGGRPMIEHVYRRAAAARGVDAVVVATDDDRIAAAVARFGGVVRMTKASHRTGTDRIAEVARDLACDIIVNVQGDLPFIEPDVITDAVALLEHDPDLQMSTVRCRITHDAEYTNPNVVKVVVDRRGHALYFSRSPIPFMREDGPAKAGRHVREAGHHVPEAGRHVPVYKHLGLYVYRRTFLLTLTTLVQTPLELAESLEQLRVLEHGYRIATVETQYDAIEVDTPEDLDRVRRQIAVGTSA